MALRSLSLVPNSEILEVWHCDKNWRTGLVPTKSKHIRWNFTYPVRRQTGPLQCLSITSSSSPVGSEEKTTSAFVEEESAHVIRFKMSDFQILDRISVGLGGRADEVVFEAVVKDPHSPLYNTTVLLRQLTSTQAQRRGRRAIEVLKKLACRKLMYHSYSMQVHGYFSSETSNGHDSFTLVHGYHGSFSLRHWLRQSDWFPTLEAALALDEESVRKVGDDTVGGPAVSRQLRLIRLLTRDLLIGVNYLHSHGLAHTELRLENVHISPVDRHIKVGILGNAADFYEDGSKGSTSDSKMDRRKMMIAFDMRCLGFMMAKMVLKELMDPVIFAKFKSFLTEGNDPSCLREFFVRILNTSPSGNAGFQMLDRNWGAGWNLLSLLLATNPSRRISCLTALKHPFLCGPRWRVVPSMDIIRWGLGSTAVRITEEYIYNQPQVVTDVCDSLFTLVLKEVHKTCVFGNIYLYSTCSSLFPVLQSIPQKMLGQRGRLIYFIESMEMLNPHSRPKSMLALLPGKWRLLYSTGRHVGLTLRQPSARVLIGDVQLTIQKASVANTTLSLTSTVGFTVMMGDDWPHDKAGTTGSLETTSLFRLTAGRRLYLEAEKSTGIFSLSGSSFPDSLARKLTSKKWKKVLPFEDLPSSLPVANLASDDIEVTMSLDDPKNELVDAAINVIQEVRTQVPPEIFDLSKLVCGTYVDSRMLILRGMNGSALLFTRSSVDKSCR